MRNEHTVIVQDEHALERLKAAEVAVAWHLLERQAGEKLVQFLRVAPAVAKVDDAVRLCELHRAHHVVDVSVRVGQYKVFHGAHRNLSSSRSTSGIFLICGLSMR